MFEPRNKCEYAWDLLVASCGLTDPNNSKIQDKKEKKCGVSEILHCDA